MASVRPASPNEVGLDRCSTWSRSQQSRPDGTMPTLDAEAKVARAVADRVPCVVVALYLDRVVATCESLICQHAETPSVVANGRFHEAEVRGNRRDRVTARQPLGDGLPGDAGRICRTSPRYVGFPHGGYAQTSIGGSSNGKTPASGAGYRGSSPCPPVTLLIEPMFASSPDGTQRPKASRVAFAPIAVVSPYSYVPLSFSSRAAVAAAP